MSVVLYSLSNASGLLNILSEDVTASLVCFTIPIFNSFFLTASTMFGSSSDSCCTTSFSFRKDSGMGGSLMVISSFVAASTNNSSPAVFSE
ncbi:hypothetical protein LguiB_012771 [Lonicera macranthoides]